jgi:glutaminyl-tRNA synthetase
MSNESKTSDAADKPSNFIRDIIDEHNRTGRFGGKVVTRFPPEPNGYLHIGHAKSICLNFGIARDYGGKCNLRFDDTNPTKEDEEFVNSIKDDVRWLGFTWDNMFWASSYFDQLYDWAVELIKKGKAYVCDLTGDQVREYRGTLNEPGKNSPYRERLVAENLDLFARMKAGEFPDASRTLRAKIDMASPNVNLRDPVLYRILHATHHNTGDTWCIYPMYDYAHGQSDSIEGITHSICTLEFENHRPLYDWFIKELGIHGPQQIEFARLNLTYTVMSKRRLLELVKGNYVRGWDDPRMPTICGIRRRGYSPAGMRLFCDRIGITKTESKNELGLLENCIREDLNKTANRVMGVLHPLKLIITDYPEGQIELLDAVNNPEDPSAGSRQIPFSRVLYIEREDFLENPPKKFFRLAPGQEVRLRYGYIIKCTNVVKDAAGNITELHCTHDPETRGKNPSDGRKVQGVIHWVSAEHSLNAEVRLYDTLFSKLDPDDVEPGQTYLNNINPNSLVTLSHAKVEPVLAEAAAGDKFQFERMGYYCLDKESTPEKLVFNRTVTLKEATFKKMRVKDKALQPAQVTQLTKELQKLAPSTKLVTISQRVNKEEMLELKGVTIEYDPDKVADEALLQLVHQYELIKF